MLTDWLALAVEKRTWEVVKICEDDNQSLFDELNIVLDRVKNNNSTNRIDEVREIEELFVRKNLIVQKAYRIGFRDALDLNKDFGKEKKSNTV